MERRTHASQNIYEEGAHYDTREPCVIAKISGLFVVSAGGMFHGHRTKRRFVHTPAENMPQKGQIEILLHIFRRRSKC